MKKRDLDKAIADYTEAINLKPDMAQAYANRGMIYEKKGDKAKADDDLARAEKLGFKRPVRVNVATNPGNFWLTPALLLLAAVVVIVAYWFVRKRRLASAVRA